MNLFLYDVLFLNLPMITIFGALMIGLWAVGNNLTNALLGKVEHESEDVKKSITTWTWIFFIFWLCIYFPIVIYKARQKHLNRKSKAENEIKAQKEAEKKAKKEEDDVKFQDEFKNKQEKLTADQKKAFDALDNKINLLGAAQSLNYSATNSKLKKLHSAIDVVGQQASAIDSKIQEIEMDNKWYHHLNNFREKFPEEDNESFRQVGSYSSKSL